jgi:hypothetical protein
MGKGKKKEKNSKTLCKSVQQLEKLSVSNIGNLETLKDWANRNDIDLSKYRPHQINFLQIAFS